MKEFRTLIDKLNEAVTVDEAPEYTAPDHGHTFNYKRDMTIDQLRELRDAVEAVDSRKLAVSIVNQAEMGDTEQLLADIPAMVTRMENMELLPPTWKEATAELRATIGGAVMGAGFFGTVIGGAMAAGVAAAGHDPNLLETAMIIGVMAAAGAGFGAADLMGDARAEAEASRDQRSIEQWEEDGGLSQVIPELGRNVESYKQDYLHFLDYRIGNLEQQSPNTWWGLGGPRKG